MSLESQISAVLNRDGTSGSEDTIVALHTAQMREWGVRGGAIEFRPVQDDSKTHRLKFLTELTKNNHLKERFDYVMDCLICRGEVLWLFLPDNDAGLSKAGSYRIEFFVGGLNNPDPQYKVFYKPGGRVIDRVMVCYPYEVDTGLNGMGKQTRWVTLKITSDWIEQSESLTKPQFNEFAANTPITPTAPTYGGYGVTGGVNRYANPFAPELPVVISKNNPRQEGQLGSDDFYWQKDLIETHEGLVNKAHKNLRMFSNPIFVTTRSPQEVLNQESQIGSQTWASQNRYVDMAGSPYSGSTNPMDTPSWGTQRLPQGLTSMSSSEGSLDTIMGNVGEGERFGFVQADAVSGDQNLWIRQLRALIHWILGGIDPDAIGNTTVFEYKSIFGRVENSANKRATALYGETGLGLAFERIIEREEKLFKEWLFATLHQLFPQQFGGLQSPAQLTDEFCQELQKAVEQGVVQLPHDYPGLIPAGDRSVTWRYLRPVFNQTAQELQQLSIVARNYREDGYSQEWVLRQQNPSEMTDQEIRNAMSGFSPRVVENAANSIQILTQLFQQFMQIPDPQDPNPDPKAKAPWGLRLGLPQLLEEALYTLRKEIGYGKPVYEPADAPSVPLSLAQLAGELQTPTPEQNDRILPDQWDSSVSSSNAYGLPDDVRALLWRSNPASIQPDRLGRANQPSSIPIPGATVTNNPTVSSTGAVQYRPVSAVQPVGAQPTTNVDAGTGAWANAVHPGVDPTIFLLYGDQLRALAAAAVFSGSMAAARNGTGN